MSKKTFFLAVLVMFSGFSLSCHSFGDPLIPIKGVVTSARNEPIEGVTVQLTENRNGEIRKAALDQITKSDGAFSFEMIGAVPEKLWIDFQKTGFKRVRKELSAEEKKDGKVDIILETN